MKRPFTLKITVLAVLVAVGAAFAATAQAATVASTIRAPTAVAFSTSGELWVADRAGDRLIGFNPNREEITEVGLEGAGLDQNMAGGIATDAASDVYVTDGFGLQWGGMSSTSRVREFSPSGTLLKTLTSPALGSPGALAIDSGGDVWVLNTLTGTVVEFSPSGSVIGGFTKQLGWSYGLAITISEKGVQTLKDVA
jgi:DNA-binding beta-propeller fold protein YncE